MKEKKQLILIFIISLIAGFPAAYFGYNILSEFEFYQSVRNLFSILGFVVFLIALWYVVRYFRSRLNKLNN